MKRRVISLFVCLAFVLLQVHNLTPHQHRLASSVLTAHDHGDHHHEQVPDEDTGSPIQDLAHHADFEKTILQPKTSQEATADWAFQAIELKEVFRLFLVPENPPPKEVFLQDQYFSTPLYTCPSVSHRGPPAFIVEA